MNAFGYTVLILWLLNNEKAWNMSDLIIARLFSSAGVQLILRYVFKFLVLRVLALDFIVRQITIDHLYDLGIAAVHRRASCHQPSEVDAAPSYSLDESEANSLPCTEQRSRGMSMRSDASSIMPVEVEMT